MTDLWRVFLCLMVFEACTTYPVTRELHLRNKQKDILTRARSADGFHVTYNNGLIVGGDASIRILLTTLVVRTNLTIAFSFLDKETSEFYLSDDSLTAIGFARNVTELGQPFTELEFRYVNFAPNKTYNVINASKSIFTGTVPSGVHVFEFIARDDSSFALLHNGDDLFPDRYLNAWSDANLLRVECRGKIEVHEYHHTYEPVVRFKTYNGVQELGGPGAVFNMEEGFSLPDSIILSGGAVIRLRGKLMSKAGNRGQQANVTMDRKYLGNFFGMGMVDVILKVFDKRLVIFEHLDPKGIPNDPKQLMYKMPGFLQIDPVFKPVNVAVYTGIKAVNLSTSNTMCS